jgi:hypothetical protein
MKIRRARIEGEVVSKVDGWYNTKGKVQWS